MTKLRVFSDLNYVPLGANPVRMIKPLQKSQAGWQNQTDVLDIDFDEYPGIEFTNSVKTAEIAVLPADWKRGYVLNQQIQLALEFAEIVRNNGIPLVVFFHGDDEWPVSISDAWVFRHSLYKSKMPARTFSMPSWNLDIMRDYIKGDLIIHEYQKQPVVGFCGKAAWTSNALIRFWAKKCLHSIQRKESVPFSHHQNSIRAKALKKMARDKRLQTNFVVRKQYYGGSFLPKTQTFNQEIKRFVTQEFVKNMLDSPYIFCARGNGNYSVRLYEALSAGRIPVFLNTDCALPYEFIINYRELFVWVEYDEMDSIVDKIVEYHQRLSPSAFKQRQHECRAIYDEYLSPNGFFQHFGEHFADLGIVK